MKIRLEYIDEESGEILILKNKESKVFYHDSKIHDSGKFEELSGLVKKFNKKEKEVVRAFYELAGILS